MTDLAIRVENLSKRYRIGQYVGSGAQYKTLRESLTNAVSAPLRRLKYISKFEIRNSKSGRSNSQFAIRNPQSNPFIWALKDVSLAVKRGGVALMEQGAGDERGKIVRSLGRRTSGDGARKA